MDKIMSHTHYMLDTFCIFLNNITNNIIFLSLSSTNLYGFSFSLSFKYHTIP